MKTFIDKMTNYNESIRLRIPNDITALNQKNKDIEKNFSVMILAYCDMEAADTSLFQLITMIQNHQGDLFTLKVMAHKIIDWNIGGFQSSYDMLEGANVLSEAKQYIDICEGHKELGELLEVIHRYFITITYWIDLSIPWSELSKTHHKIKSKA